MARLKHGDLMHVNPGGSAFPFDPVGGDPTGAALQSPVTYLASSDLTASVIISPSYAAIQDGGSEYLELYGATSTIRSFAGIGFVVPVNGSDPLTGEAGAIYFNNATNKFRGYDGSSWVDLN